MLQSELQRQPLSRSVHNVRYVAVRFGARNFAVFSVLKWGLSIYFHNFQFNIPCIG
jgi:hypothetical protein